MDNGLWSPLERIPTVTEMVEHMSLTVTGLHDVKLRLATILRRHAIAAQHERDYHVPNFLMIGPSGGGKTWSIRAACEAAGLIYIEANAVRFSEVGTHGLDLSQMLAGFWSPRWLRPPHKRKEIVPLAERYGVVVIDELDKWAFVPNLLEKQPGRLLQNELLRFVEGEDVWVKESDRIGEQPIVMSTRHMLFIGVGAFQSLGRFVDPTDASSYMRATPDDIARYGFLEELAGRFATIVGLPPLQSNDMYRITCEQVWPRYLQQAQDEGFRIEYDEAALRNIGDQALQLGVGVRGLDRKIEDILMPAWAQASPGGVLRLSLNEARAQRAVFLPASASRMASLAS
jgi:ATP-dependent protease Clp ATPase subunit